MSMTARLWSISALAVELRMDRRTVAHALRDVSPDGEVNGNRAWRLTTALDALRPRKAGTFEPDLSAVPDYLRPIVALKDPAHRAAALMHVWTVHQAPALATWAVVEAGGTMSLAFETARNLPLMLIIETAKIAREWGLEPWKSQDEPGLYCPDAFAEVNWPELREKAGEPDWTPPEPIPGFRTGLDDPSLPEAA
jgi:hypothetical protein